MKKLTILLTAAAFAITALTSCEKPEDQPNDDPETTENVVIFDGQTFEIIGTRFETIPWMHGTGANSPRFRHTMVFSTSATHNFTLIFITNSEQFAGGTFTFGDIQRGDPNMAAGLLNLPNAQGINILWGSEFTATRSPNNTLTIEFTNVPTNSEGEKTVSFHFNGKFENTDPGDDPTIDEYRDFVLMPILQEIGAGQLNLQATTWGGLLIPGNPRFPNLEELLRIMKMHSSLEQQGASVVKIMQVGAAMPIEITEQTPINSATRIRVYYESNTPPPPPSVVTLNLWPILNALIEVPGQQIPATVTTWGALLPFYGRFTSLPALINAVKAEISSQHDGRTVAILQQIGATQAHDITHDLHFDRSTLLRVAFQQ